MHNIIDLLNDEFARSSSIQWLRLWKWESEMGIENQERDFGNSFLVFEIPPHKHMTSSCNYYNSSKTAVPQPLPLPSKTLSN
jgi:hypothetical protein